MTTRKFLLEDLYNDGERLIPFLSHDDEETIRHLSSHIFFKNIIQKDVSRLGLDDLTVLDLGFGAGYGSYIYAKINNVTSVTSIDVSDDSLEWARENYYNSKIHYEICDARKFLKKSKPFSYILTRHVLEHIEDGLNVISETNYTNRVCINVPFNEKKGNPFHVLTGIKKDDFPNFKNVEFFYEDLYGNTYDKIPDDIYINSIICIGSKDGMPKVADYFKFPVKAPSVENIFNELSSDNFNFIKNLLSIQNHKIRKGRAAINDLADYKKTNKNLQKDIAKLVDSTTILNAEIEKHKKELNSKNKELESIYQSKKWKYATKIGKVKNKISPKR